MGTSSHKLFGQLKKAGDIFRDRAATIRRNYSQTEGSELNRWATTALSYLLLDRRALTLAMELIGTSAPNAEFEASANLLIELAEEMSGQRIKD